jgi:peptidyl-tRNA hydrolase, PTH1 family
MTKLVVGLGNVGPRYRSTRHNIGFMVAAELGERYRLTARTRGRAVVAQGRIRDQDVALAQPTTMMNVSGRAVAELRKTFNVFDVSNLLIVYDEMDLPLGTLRFRGQGSAGGHNGLKSIIEVVGTQEFPRLRVGVGRPPMGVDPIDHVLSTFRPEEKPILDQVVRAAADAVECWLESGVDECMSRFNGWKPAVPGSEAPGGVPQPLSGEKPEER